MIITVIDYVISIDLLQSMTNKIHGLYISNNLCYWGTSSVFTVNKTTVPLTSCLYNYTEGVLLNRFGIVLIIHLDQGRGFRNWGTI